MDLGGPKEPCFRWGAYWRHLANTIEPSMRGGDAAFLSNYYFDQLFFLYFLQQLCEQYTDFSVVSLLSSTAVFCGYRKKRSTTP